MATGIILNLRTRTFLDWADLDFSEMIFYFRSVSKGVSMFQDLTDYTTILFFLQEIQSPFIVRIKTYIIQRIQDGDETP